MSLDLNPRPHNVPNQHEVNNLHPCSFFMEFCTMFVNHHFNHFYIIKNLGERNIKLIQTNPMIQSVTSSMDFSLVHCNENINLVNTKVSEQVYIITASTWPRLLHLSHTVQIDTIPASSQCFDAFVLSLDLHLTFYPVVFPNNSK